MTSMAVDGTSSSEFDGYVDTGSYTLNAALSGSIFNGIPNNKVTVFGGDPATGKTFFVLGIIKQWLTDNKEGYVFYCDTESAVTNKMLEDRGIDLTRVIKSEPETIEQFRQTILQLLDKYMEVPIKQREPLLIVLDSLGNLSSVKEVEDIRAEKDTRDMTKAGLIRGTFRVLRLRLAKANVPMVVTNHVYSVVGAYVPTKALSGGSGLIYASDCIAMLSKSKERDKERNVVGNIVKIRMEKSRLSKENSEVEVRISYSGGLDRFHGILEMAVDAGMVENNNGRYLFPGFEKTATANKIAESPTTYFTPDFLKKLDENYVQPNFSYGRIVATQNEPILEEE